MPHIIISWWLEVSSLWGSVSGQEVQLHPSLDYIYHMILILVSSVSLTSLGMIISTSAPVACLGIISYFFTVEKYCIVFMYAMYQFNCASTISLISSLGDCTLGGQNHKVIHLFFFFFNILAVFWTPPQFKHKTQAGSGSRDGIAAQIREVAGNKLGTDFFSFCLGHAEVMSKCSWFAVLCLLIVYNRLIQLWQCICSSLDSLATDMIA